MKNPTPKYKLNIQKFISHIKFKGYLYYKLKNLSINRKIFWGMVFTSTLIICFIFFSTCMIIINHHMSMTTTSSMHELSYISKQLTFSLTTVENFSKTIAVDPIVQELAIKHSHQEHRFNDLDVIVLKNRVDTIIQSTAFIHSVSLYGKNQELIATTDIATTPPSIEGITITDNVWLSREKMLPYDVQDTINVLSFLKGFYSYDLGELLGYIEISIPETAISEIYLEHSIDGYSSQFILNQYGLVQSTDGFYKLYQHYSHFDALAKYSSGYSFIDKDIVFYKYFPKLDWYIIRAIDTNYFLKPIYSLVLISAFIALCGVIFSTIFSHKISNTITSPIHRLIAHIQNVIGGNWEPINEITTNEEIGFLTGEFNKMLTAQSKLKDDLIREQKIKQKISLDLLQQQVNPHFLYNALDNICSLAELDEKDKLMEIVMNLSSFYRETLNEGSFFVTIEKELSIIDAYLKIMQIRYYKKFDYTIRCPESLKKHKCLKLLLQPIVENSIYHGIKEMLHKGTIWIDVYEKEDSILFAVADNGIGISDEQIEKIWSSGLHSFSIKNIDQRIKLYYGDEYGLSISSNTLGGCTATITINCSD